jgi:hypothetical protein
VAKSSISMRELQKMSAASLQALPHPLPVKTGEMTVAVLMPVRKAPDELVKQVLARIDAMAAKRSPERTRELEAILDEPWPDDEGA